MTGDFESFLRESAKAKVLDQWGDMLAPLFQTEDDPVDSEQIQQAEDRIGTSLPDSYKAFLRVLGPGIWGGVEAAREDEFFISPPEDVLVIDQDDGGDMGGFVIVARKFHSSGECLAFNPSDLEVEGERPVYYCCHDPLGYAKVADSFELWARSVAEAATTGADFYSQFDDEIWVRWEEYRAKQPKRWWEFWR